MKFPMRARKKSRAVSAGGTGRGKDIGYGISDMGVRKAESGIRKAEKNLSELSASAVQRGFTAETQRRGGVFGGEQARKDALGDLSASTVQTATHLGVGPYLANVFMQKEVMLSRFQLGSYAGGHSC